MRKVIGLLLVVSMLAVWSAVGLAQIKTTVHGVYTAWGLSQNNFFLGKFKGKDNYWVQMLRFNIAVGTDNFKAVTRLDLGQGWWGVDNVERRKTPGSATALFDFKDTNYLLHVDQAYMFFKIPDTRASLRVGRQSYRLGNKLVLDCNLDGIQADIGFSKGKITLGWAKMSEGYDGLSDNSKVKPDWQGNTDARDANLLFANVNLKGKKHNVNLFGLFYKDRGISDNTSYILEGLDYFMARFSPNITSLLAIGAAGDFKFGKLNLQGEIDLLTGKDEIDQLANGLPQNYEPKQRYDVNDGNISGYNLYLRPTIAVTDKLSIGAVFGMGSGDDDVTSGKGNVNRLRTVGFFYVTEVWEDSIMPDEEGITPQGLGAPNTRGYREFENTTLLQLNATLTPTKKLSIFGSVSLIRATQPIYAWHTETDAEGNTYWTLGSESSKDIGTEIDFRIQYNFYKNVFWRLRGGYLMPGDACAYLINGTNQWKEKPWEIKTEFWYKF